MSSRAERAGRFGIFIACPPGLEPVLAEEVRLKGFRQPKPVPGGVETEGGWPEVWRANLWLRGATRVLARLDAFHTRHLAHLDDRARAVPWAAVLRPDVPVRVEASCTRSRIWHSGAAAERIARAISATLGAPAAEDAPVTVMARIEDDLCTISLDTSDEPLHRRGWKQQVNPAPLRETLAALFLRQCGYDGTAPLLDPMCGAGTFVIEAAEIAARLNPGRLRSFGFEHLATFDPAAWAAMRGVRADRVPGVPILGSDRDAGAIAMAEANAARAGVGAIAVFRRAAISEAAPPEGPPGLVIVNPPYGTRMGEGRDLLPLYQSFGRVMRERFGGWRIGLVTSEARLARATGLPWRPADAPVPHGGLRVTLWRCGPL